MRTHGPQHTISRTDRIVAKVDALLRQLPHREERMLRLRFGITDRASDPDKPGARCRRLQAAGRIEARLLRRLWETATAGDRPTKTHAGRSRA